MVRTQLMAGVTGLMLMASFCGAQGLAAPSGASEVISNGGLLNTLIAAPVTGQPYSAQRVQHKSQKLSDGTTISHKGHHFVARDGEGRVRVELRVGKAPKGEAETELVFVSDPMAHTITTWMTGPKAQQVASVVKIPQGKRAESAAQTPAANEATRPQPVVTTENLGMQMVHDVQVSDVRTTTVVPVGRSGNDAPITKTVEVWTSTDMKLVMKEQWEDPRRGERTVELEDFSRAEPDPALFRAPQGYVVKTAMESLKELEDKLGASQN
jgi:hypothetical protein